MNLKVGTTFHHPQSGAALETICLSSGPPLLVYCLLSTAQNKSQVELVRRSDSLNRICLAFWSRTEASSLHTLPLE
eukprot:scaffold10055_cov63-Cyclotella_meneghiniana.AAC.4